ncbi:Retinoblastoma-associated protein [Branchiostoma belcheri]|nr:Retinoblastoma-associated protein [Branchiostoma belcheri]
MPLPDARRRAAKECVSFRLLASKVSTPNWAKNKLLLVVGDSEGWAPPSNNDTQDEHVGRTYCTCAEPRIFAFCMPQLSPLPCKSPSRFSQSPVITVPGRSNFYISPLRESPFSSPVRRELLSPGQMTPRPVQFGEGLGSSEKLRAINESMRAAAAGKRTSPVNPGHRRDSSLMQTPQTPTGPPRKAAQQTAMACPTETQVNTEWHGCRPHKCDPVSMVTQHCQITHQNHQTITKEIVLEHHKKVQRGTH